MFYTFTAFYLAIAGLVLGCVASPLITIVFWIAAYVILRMGEVYCHFTEMDGDD